MIPILALCENIEPDLIHIMFKRTAIKENQYRLAKNKNCPAELKVKVYEETGDTSLLPEDLVDIFIF